MSIGLALLVSADPVAIQQVSLALRELSISPDICQEVEGAVRVLNRRKFDAVIVDSLIFNWENSADGFWTRCVCLYPIEQR
jgi:hypothetical protein